MLPIDAVNPVERKRKERIRKENSEYYCSWCRRQKSPEADLCFECEKSVERDRMREHRMNHSEESPDYYCRFCNEEGWV